MSFINVYTDNLCIMFLYCGWRITELVKGHACILYINIHVHKYIIVMTADRPAGRHSMNGGKAAERRRRRNASGSPRLTRRRWRRRRKGVYWSAKLTPESLGSLHLTHAGSTRRVQQPVKYSGGYRAYLFVCVYIVCIYNIYIDYIIIL